MPDDREYLLGTDDEELVRLGIQHRLWAESAVRLWEKARIKPGARVLDIGSGPGYATIDLAQLVGPAGLVVAVDESQRFISHIRATAGALHVEHIQAHCADVRELSTLNLPAGFDAAWIRWVLCFLPDPSPVLAAVHDLLRPGGRLAIQDYFNYEAMALAPRRPIFHTVIDAVARSWRATGGDLDVMARIPKLCRAHNLRLVDLAVTQRVARPDEPAWQWPTVFWRSFLPRLVQMGHLAEDDRQAFMAMWDEASQDPDTFMVLPPVFSVVAERMP